MKPEQVSEPMSIHTSLDDDEIKPLSGKPFFHMLMSKSHVCSPYQLVPPAKAIRMLPSETIPVILIRGSRSWEITYFGNHPTHKKFDSRWRTFAADNELKVGDICLFELMARESTLIKFKVQVLRGDFPSALLDRQSGTRDKPIVLDDD